MGFFEDAVDYANKQANQTKKNIERKYVQNLRKASDAIVMQKLRQAEEEGHFLYDVTYAEARKRGLV